MLNSSNLSCKYKESHTIKLLQRVWTYIGSKLRSYIKKKKKNSDNAFLNLSSKVKSPQKVVRSSQVWWGLKATVDSLVVSPRAGLSTITLSSNPTHSTPLSWPLEHTKQRVFFCSVCRINRWRGQQGERDKDSGSMCACVFAWECTPTPLLIWCGDAPPRPHSNCYISNRYTSKFIWHTSCEARSVKLETTKTDSFIHVYICRLYFYDYFGHYVCTALF